MVAVRLAVLLSVLCPTLCLWGEEVWMFIDNHMKMGKSELYFSLEKEWLEEYKKYGKENQALPIYVFQDLDAPHVTLMVPLKDYGALDHYFQLEKGVCSSMPDERGESVARDKEGTLNSSAYSLGQRVQRCDFIPPRQNSSFFSLPYVYLYTFSLQPGSEKAFEDKMQVAATEQRRKKGFNCWRTWRVTVGTNEPKYMVFVYAQSQEELALQLKELDLANQMPSEIIKKQHHSLAYIRSDLCVRLRDLD